MNRPNHNISYRDLKSTGWEVEFDEGQVVGEIQQYKVVSCRYNGKVVPRKQFLEGLEGLGLDLMDQGIQVDLREHRSLTEGLVVDYRFYAPERIDHEWVSSGYASQDAKECVSKMGGLQGQLQSMRNTSQWD